MSRESLYINNDSSSWKAKSGKELVGFLMNDVLLLAQPTKSLPSGQQFSFERNANQKFKLYRKVSLKNLSDEQSSGIELYVSLQPTFLSELCLLSESEVNGNDTSDNSRTIRLKDSKKITVLLAPSASECSLWIKRLTEARRAYLENEKNHLQRQRSSEYNYCRVSVCLKIIILSTE